MKEERIEGRYSGNYFGAEYFNHVYEPTEDCTKHLLSEFKHKWSLDDWVMFREKHKATEYGIISQIAYSTERNGGETVKVYKLKGRWIDESRIKKIAHI